MLCDDCKKNEACVHITQISPEGKIDKNLCADCASKYGNFLLPSNQDEEKTEKNFSVDDFLKGIFSSAQKKQAVDKTEQEASTEMSCPNCGMSYHDFLHTGKIGCSVCYNTFRQQLEPILRRIHGASTHSGKIPHRTGGALEIKHEIALMKKELQKAVSNEEYEKAAVYRDKVRSLEKKLAELPGEEREA